MVRRAGIMEAPTGETSPVNIESGARGAQAIAQTWGEIANATAALRKSMQPALNREMEQKAGEAAAAGDFRQRWTMTEQDAAYNAAIRASFLAQAQNDIDTRLAQVERDNALDPEGFGVAAESVKSGALEGVPSDYAVAVGQYIDREVSRGAIRVAGRRTEQATRESEAALKSRLEVLDARNSELLPSDPAWAEYMLDREDVLQALGNPLYGITDEELQQNRDTVFSRATANAISKTALGMYENEPGAEGAAKAYGFIDEQFKRTDLTLTSAQRDQFIGEARRSIARAETERKAQEREIARNIRETRREITEDVRDEIESLDTLLDAGALPDEGRINSLVDAAEQTGRPSLIYQARDLRARHQAVTGLKGLSALDAGNRMAEWKAAAEAGDESAARRYNAGADYLQAAATQQRTKPLEFLRDHYGERLSPIDTPDGWRARIEQAGRAAQQAGGVQPQYLLDQEKNVLAALSDNGGDQAYGVAMQIWRAAPPEVARQIFREIGPGGPAMGYAGMVLSEAGNENAARLILKGQQMKRRQESGGYQPAAFKDEERDAIFDRLVPTVLQGAARADRRRAADLLFEGRFSETSDATKAGYERAVREVLGEREINGRTFGGAVQHRGLRIMAPVWIRQDQFGVVMNSLLPVHFRAASVTGGMPMVRPPGGRIREASLAEMNSMKLVPAGAPGRYYLSQKSAPDADGVWDVVGDENGQSYIIDLNKIRASLAAQRPDAVVPEQTNGR